MARTVRFDSSSPTNTFVLQMFPANKAPLSAATSFAMASACRFIASSKCSLPIKRSFSRWA